MNLLRALRIKLFHTKAEQEADPLEKDRELEEAKKRAELLRQRLNLLEARQDSKRRIFDG